MKSFSDATNAALNYKKNWAFIDVLDDIDPEDSCKNTKNLGKIGIIASADIVAVEQCAVDFLIGNADVDSATKSAWETAHQIKVLEYAEKQGNGNRKYQLKCRKTVDLNFTFMSVYLLEQNEKPRNMKKETFITIQNSMPYL